MKNKLSVVIITKNEEKNIERCLTSVLWADEIVVVDSGSVDNTVRICELYQNVIIHKTHWMGFGKTKQAAVDLAKYNWILSLDADEEITLELKDEILSVLSNPLCDGYRANRKSFYINKWIEYCGWNKDFPVRLFDKRKGKFNEKMVHESIIVNGKVGSLSSVMLHHTYPDFKTYILKMEHYASLATEDAEKKGKKSSVGGAIGHGVFKFFQMYFLKKGFLDGKTGLILSINSAFSVYYKHIKIWEKLWELN